MKRSVPRDPRRSWLRPPSDEGRSEARVRLSALLSEAWSRRGPRESQDQPSALWLRPAVGYRDRAPRASSPTGRHQRDPSSFRTAASAIAVRTPAHAWRSRDRSHRLLEHSSASRIASTCSCRSAAGLASTDRMRRRVGTVLHQTFGLCRRQLDAQRLSNGLGDLLCTANTSASVRSYRSARGGIVRGVDELRVIRTRSPERRTLPSTPTSPEIRRRPWKVGRSAR